MKLSKRVIVVLLLVAGLVSGLMVYLYGFRSPVLSDTHQPEAVEVVAGPSNVVTFCYTGNSKRKNCKSP